MSLKNLPAKWKEVALGIFAPFFIIFISAVCTLSLNVPGASGIALLIGMSGGKGVRTDKVPWYMALILTFFLGLLPLIGMTLILWAIGALNEEPELFYYGLIGIVVGLLLGFLIGLPPRHPVRQPIKKT